MTMIPNDQYFGRVDRSNQVKIETLKHPPENGNGASASPLSSSEASNSKATTEVAKEHQPDPKVDMP